MSDFKNIILKMIIALLIVQVVIMPISNRVRAASFWEEVINGGDGFLEDGKSSASSETASDEKTSELISILYNTLLTLGVIVTVAVGGILGIKFMTSSAEDKAKIKESMIPYVAGSIAIFGAFAIWKLVIQVFSNI